MKTFLLCLGAVINFQFWTNSSTKWNCENDTKIFLVAIFTQSSQQQFYLSVNAATGDVVTSQTSNFERWGIATYDGKRSSDFKPVCRMRGAFCGVPIPGLNSFLVTSETKSSNYLHIPVDLAKKV